MFVKEYLISFLMISRLKDFALVVLWLLMLKVYAFIGTLNVEFFNFSSPERVNQNAVIDINFNKEVSLVWCVNKYCITYVNN